MRIAVCDSEEGTLYMIRQVIRQTQAQLREEPLVYYDSQQALGEDYRCGVRYDLIFLAAEALEAGRLIRQMDKAVLLFLLGADYQRLIEAFHLKAFVFLLKPLDKKQLRQEISRALETYQAAHYCCQFTGEKRPLSISIEHIVFIESKGRSLDVYTSDHHRLNVHAKMADAEAALASWGFVRCHKSFLVNVAYVKEVGQRDMITSLWENGQPVLVDVSERRRAQVRQVVLDHQAGRISWPRTPIAESAAGDIEVGQCQSAPLVKP